MKTLIFPAIVLSCLSSLGGCSRIAVDAVGQASLLEVDRDVVTDIEVPAGYQISTLVEGLTYPSSMTFDEDGVLYVLESHTLPIPGMEPQIVQISGDEIEELTLEGWPGGESAVGLTFHDGWLWFTHEEKEKTFGIYRVRRSGGAIEAVARGFPSTGDHDLNYIVFAPNGDLFVGQGSATNSGVVSSHDPVNEGWLADHPDFRDIPCRDIRLTDRTFTEDNALTEAEDDRATTGAYQPYGTSGAGSVSGSAMCTGAIYRLRGGTGTPEVWAWGFRNPVSVAFDDGGRLYVGMHGADVRSTRPIISDPDVVYRVEKDVWYGWPDFSAELRPITDPRYLPPRQYRAGGHDSIEFVLDHAASGLRPADRSLLVSVLEPHSAVGGMAIIPETGPFSRWAGDILISEMGDFAPLTDPTLTNRAGFQVERIDIETGERTTFARNRSDGDPQPASSLDLEDGLERPVDVKIGPDGLVYILDYGVLQISEEGQKILPATGRVFVVEPQR